MSGAEQQACCCDKLHPCCASWDEIEICRFGGADNCAGGFGTFSEIPFTLRKYELKYCFESEEQCRQHYANKTNLTVDFKEDVLCDDETTIPHNRLPANFCVNPDCKKPCPNYVCDECGPISDGCVLIPCNQECPSPPTCPEAECCNSPPKYCCCITISNGATVGAQCSELPPNEPCVPPAGLTDGGLASECPNDCIKWYAVRRYKTCKQGNCASCPGGKCNGTAHCCNTWITEVSEGYKCIGSYTDDNGDLQPCPDGLDLDTAERPNDELFQPSQQYAQRCSAVYYCWIANTPCQPITGIQEGNCGDNFPPPIQYAANGGPCLGGMQCSPITSPQTIPILPSPISQSLANLYCQTLSIPAQDPTLPPGIPPNWSSSIWGECDCQGTRPNLNSAAVADSLCACCGCPPPPGDSPKAWGCKEDVTPTGGPTGPGWPGGGSGGGWGPGGPPPIFNPPGVGVSNTTICFEVSSCEECERRPGCDPGVFFLCDGSHCPSQSCCPGAGCPPLCPPCGFGCSVTGPGGCCTANGGCRGFECRCQLRAMGPCGCPSNLAGDLQYTFSLNNRAIEKDLTKGYVYDKNGNVQFNTIFLFGYGESFL